MSKKTMGLKEDKRVYEAFFIAFGALLILISIIFVNIMMSYTREVNSTLDGMNSFEVILNSETIMDSNLVIVICSVSVGIVLTLLIGVMYLIAKKHKQMSIS